MAELIAVVEDEIAVEFVCRKCGHRQRAHVKSKGRGSSSLFSGEQEAREGAAQAAAVDLVNRAAELATMAPCPACRFVDDEAIGAARSRVLLQCVGLIAVGLVIAWMAPGHSLWAWTVPAACLVAAVVTYQKASWRWEGAAERVKFISGPSTKPVRTARQGLKLSFAWGETLDDCRHSWPFVNGLRLGLLYVSGAGPTWAESTDLEGQSAGEARRKVLAEMASDDALEELEPGVYRGWWDDQLSASRLAAVELFSGLSLRGQPVAFTPTEDSLFVAGSEDPAGLERAFAAACRDIPRVLEDETSSAGRFTTQPWLLTEEGWQPWQVPDGHALRQQLAVLDATFGSSTWRPSA